MAFLAGVLATLVLASAALVSVSLIARRRFGRHRAAFRCRIRSSGGWRRWGRARRWRLRRTGARWVNDVLLLQSGPLGLSVSALTARIAPGSGLRRLSSTEVKGLGHRPWALALRTDDGASLEVAAADVDRERLVGPYLTVALSGLPSAPHEHGV